MYLKQGEFPFGAAARDSRSRIHERTNSLGFLGIILSVLRLGKVSCMDFLNQRGGGYGFLSGIPPFSFTVYSRNCKRLCESVAVTVNSQVENC
jgi:hypothetical protein